MVEDMLLCDDCLKKIKKSLSKEAKQVLKVVYELEAVNRTEIQAQIKLSFAITGNAIDELKHKFLIKGLAKGRSKIYYLTENGEKVYNFMEADVNENIGALVS